LLPAESTVVDRSAIAVVSIAAMMCHPAVAGDTHLPTDPCAVWRKAENDAINCLYFLLRLSEIEVSYHDVAAYFDYGARTTSCQELAKAAGYFGLQLEVRRCRPADIEVLDYPAIVYLENSVGDPGRVSVVLSMRDSRCLLVEGPTASLASISRDSFLRTWSGYALLPPRQGIAHNGTAVSLSCICVVVAHKIYCSWRLSRSKITVRSTS
jgi:hypothetical protein